MKENARLHYLLDCLTAHTATTAELEELISLVGQDPGDNTIAMAVSWLMAPNATASPAYDEQHWMQVANQILMADKLPGDAISWVPPRMHFLHKWGWAAAVVLLLGTAAYFVNHYTRKPPAMVFTETPSTVIAPGKNGAVLTLANGAQIVLDSLGNGIIAQQNGAQLVLDNNELQYTGAASDANATAYNTISTPKGRQFRVVLPDGTRVWLNAASSLQYPIAFNGKERIVQLNGEAFFEVTKNVQQPFKVRILQQLNIEVLGTSFNVNAYTNEKSSTTTLIDGAIAISLAHQTSTPMVLKPGEQLQSQDGNMKINRHANVEKAVAWKNGLFSFQDVGLREMMRQLERWYNLDVVYEGNVPDVKFFGEMSRALPLSDVLAGLERSDVHFRLEDGRRLVVMP
ncbi:FecR family protein [Chitinophaga sp. 30R24]|uniref:FecR family protein n=1 Tax=Chitinophaga sp. 30R24 TaxID=3248838 RepID=UPI003B902D89